MGKQYRHVEQIADEPNREEARREPVDRLAAVVLPDLARSEEGVRPPALGTESTHGVNTTIQQAIET